MTTTVSVPARYRRHALAALALMAREAARDAEYRSETDTQVRRFAPVPDTLIDADATGMVTITVDVDPNAPEPTGDFSHFTRIGEHCANEEHAAR